MLVRGVVHSADGELVDGAVVVFLAAPVDVPDIAAVTGDDGSFVVAVPAPGRYRLGIRADGHGLYAVDVDVDPGTEVDIRATLERDDAAPPA